jgi:hypothetical protein
MMNSAAPGGAPPGRFNDLKQYRCRFQFHLDLSIMSVFQEYGGNRLKWGEGRQTRTPDFLSFCIFKHPERLEDKIQ